MTEYKCGSAKQCQFGDMCKPKYDIGGCSHYKEKRTQTNEDWFCQLPTEQKARFFSHEMRCEFCPNQEQCDSLGTNCKALWEVWLKQPHTKE